MALIYITVSFFDSVSYVSGCLSVDLQADDIQILLSKQHTVVRLFMETKNALNKGEESTSASTIT